MTLNDFEVVIGLEIHAQLLTKSKLFCSCSTAYGQPPNTQTCPVCLGLPGALPVVNREAVFMAIKFALAVGAQINHFSEFSRKHYFYPDLPKGYQITQYEHPIATGGSIILITPEGKKSIGLERINLEEDAGKSIHDGLPDSSYRTSLDFNRCGVPLIEIVGRPEIHSPEEAVEFLQALRTLLLYLEICDGNMEEGSLRCDANISVRPKGSMKLGVKTEIKNLNSFRFLHKALEYEAKRQAELLASGQTIHQETRLYDPDENKTFPMRSKEEAHDYRYFPEPDLPPLILKPEMIEEAHRSLPELPHEKIERFMTEFELPLYDAKILTSSPGLADYFEQTARLCGFPKSASNWIMREVLRYLKEKNQSLEMFPIPPSLLAELISLVENKKVTMATAKDVIFPEMISQPRSPQEIIKEKGLHRISDEEKIKAIITQVIEKNPGPVNQYKQGKSQVFGFLMGQVMKETRGLADPQLVQAWLKAKLDELASQS
ncbi:MAG: Asp-tRNA(Asn)/Glu-tRNA(Gln) amidotransferase subunit GatB [Candidatus Aminicenantes bacterium]|nr:Asp-tRNA(Asn)/Glu-tRNA(Gln) amidotransferase subunit GatB [Candidatus Aminicenantes bacterium]